MRPFRSAHLPRRRSGLLLAPLLPGTAAAVLALARSGHPGVALCLLAATALVTAVAAVAVERRRRDGGVRAWAAPGTRDIELWLAARSQRKDG